MSSFGNLIFAFIIIARMFSGNHLNFFPLDVVCLVNLVLLTNKVLRFYIHLFWQGYPSFPFKSFFFLFLSFSFSNIFRHYRSFQMSVVKPKPNLSL